MTTKTMRDAFIERIAARMQDDKSLFFVCADFGSPKLDRIRAEFKDRFVNVGIAEQNLINVATGLAFEGFTVYAYAIAPFLTMRAYEQIRVNLSLHAQLRDVNVNLVGVGGGMSYDVSGPTHHCVEDIIIMNALPRFVVFSPSDWALAESFVDYSIRVKTPKYIRFDGKPTPRIHADASKIRLEDGFVELRRGSGACIVSTGHMTHTALKASESLAGDGIKTGVIDAFLLKPMNEDLLFEALRNYGFVITLEEGFINKGGLDCLVARLLENRGNGIRLKRMGLGDAYVFDIGNREYLHRLAGMDAGSVAREVKTILKGA